MKANWAKRKAAGIPAIASQPSCGCGGHAALPTTREAKWNGSKLRMMFPGKTFKTLTKEERSQYFFAIDKRNIGKWHPLLGRKISGLPDKTKLAIQPMTIELTNQQKVDLLVGNFFTTAIKEAVKNYLDIASK